MGTAARRLVVGYDGSQDADQGLDWAIDLARATGARVDVFCSVGGLEHLPERTANGADGLLAGWLQKAERRLAEAGLTDWTSIPSEAEVVPELLDLSKDADLLVLGAQGHGVLGGMLLGSVSQHVTRHASCPVVVVRGQRSPHSGRVVVGVDGSASARKAVSFAFAYAAAVGAPVTAVHGSNVASMPGPFDIDVGPMIAEEAERSRRMLAEEVAGAREEHPEVPVELLALPVPAVRALADASRDAALVVVGTRGRGGFLGLLLGSVSATVLHQADCPVAVVR